MQVLRPYQQDAIERTRQALRRTRRVVLMSPTGAGKTTIACAMIQGCVERGSRAVFLAHRRELIFQARDRLFDHGIRSGVLMGSEQKDGGAPVQVASIQTMTNRKTQPPADLIIVDECHRTVSESYMKWLAGYPDAYVVGLSATPYRHDGKGLGDYYGELVEGPGPSELVDLGFLVDADIWCPPMTAMKGAKLRAGDFISEDMETRMNTSTLVGDIVKHWLEIAKDRPSVAFAVSVAHSQHIARQFQEAGVSAEHLDGDTDYDTRAGIMQRLTDGITKVVCNCAVFTEGWDCPAASCAILARPTQSRGLYRQMAGRVLRPFPGKDRAIILDHGANVNRFGHIMEPETVTLQHGAEVGAKKKGDGTTQCRKCYLVFRRAGLTVCPGCGAGLGSGGVRELRQVDGKLVKVSRADRPRRAFDPVRAEIKLRELQELAKAKNYKHGWVWYRMVSIYGEHNARQMLRRKS